MANTCLYYKQQKYVSYNSGATWQPLNEYRKGELYEADSLDCGYSVTYRWALTSGYTCVERTKYQKTQKQVSFDGGDTWDNVSPAEYGLGGVIEYDSSDCHDYSNDYLTFVALEDGTFTLKGSSVEYSLDSGLTWNTLARNTESPRVSRGNKIMWKTELVPPYAPWVTTYYFTSTNRFDVEGNIMSLVYSDNFRGQTSLSGKDYIFTSLFEECTKLQNAKNLILPATTLSERCYYEMFWGCTSLRTAPRLPATTLTPLCYRYMFCGCTSLTSAPQLPATTLAEYCYEYMFASCTSLTSAPQLPATTLAEYCYKEMFAYCTSLTTAPQLSATTLAKSCYSRMFQGCTSLTTAPSILPATTLADDCYNGMFIGCTSLTTAPQLSATTLASGCCRGMFASCTSLTSAPELRATTLKYYCYGEMFSGCTSLTTAPQLPAKKTVLACYISMFEGCTSLNSITCLATDISANVCTLDWVKGVAANGTFTKASSMSSWPSGDGGIPNGWTVVNYS